MEGSELEFSLRGVDGHTENEKEDERERSQLLRQGDEDGKRTRRSFETRRKGKRKTHKSSVASSPAMRVIDSAPPG